MQSGDGDTLRSCFDSLKNAVMGCCYSICHKENDAQENPVNERTHLLEVPEQQQEAPAPAVSATTPPKKPDEQSALNRILHETATNVIDVGALGPYALEPAVYSERVRAYTARLANAPPVPVSPLPRLLQDVSTSERQAVLAKPGILNEDRDLITNAVKRAAAAMSELHVEHHEELVVPFRVP
ncbi:hypothetical protein JYU34_010586 [Plutella xylostella]|uniref:Uncharacterized protein n=2 Tax=Plutella xylostella TaxID=51655 RepID=A0ABQ7QIR9_PLUXY|nr:hypothetical protein JYU34_010586 [Plutella xylostella]CAG9133066.1 unnamed protein product [Plutella xylostella]